MYNVICKLQLRQSLVNEGNKPSGTFFNSEADKDDNEYDNGNPDFDMPDNADFDMPENAYMEEDLPPCGKEVRRDQ